MTDPGPHIRPKKRETATRMPYSAVAMESSASARTTQPAATSLPKGILKAPKYSRSRAGNQSTVNGDKTSGVPVTLRDETIQERPREAEISSRAAASPSSSLAIDGYTPRVSMAASSTATTSSVISSLQLDPLTAHQDVATDSDSHDEQPLVFQSLSQLLETAGTLPAQDDPSPAVIEANLAFQCMDAETFQDYQRMKEAEYYEACLGRPLGLQAYSGRSDDGKNLEDDTDENTDPSVEQDDLLWFGDDEDDEDEEEEDPAESRPPRLFTSLWSAISQWVTPQAVDYVRELSDRDYNHDVLSSLPSVYDTTDIGVSRCAGIQALLKMHCKRCWNDELKQPSNNLRLAEQRLGELLRCFDYGQPSPKLTTAQVKALTCVLLEAVMRQDMTSDTLAVPHCCETLDMTMDEYVYLARTALVSFGTPADEDDDFDDDF